MDYAIIRSLLVNLPRYGYASVAAEIDGERTILVCNAENRWRVQAYRLLRKATSAGGASGNTG